MRFSLEILLLSLPEFLQVFVVAFNYPKTFLALTISSLSSCSRCS